MVSGFAQKVRNATNGSWWYFQIQPAKERVDNWNARRAPEEPSLEYYSLTAIPNEFLFSSGALCAQFLRSVTQGRMDFNNPPTAVGGISAFCAKPW